MKLSRRRRPLVAAAGSPAFCAALAALLTASSAFGQAVERHLPSQETPQAPAIQTPAIPGTIEDDRALGAPLGALILLGTKGAVETNPGPAGLRMDPGIRLDSADDRAELERFLGKPISRKLISEIETTIVKRYRKLGYPFVEVSTPEQEIDQGVLQIRVVEFHVGKIKVGGAKPAEAAHVENQLRLKPGDPIDSPRLAQDFDWMSRYPYRSETPAFTPGANLGETDLDISVADVKPWQVSAGYSNSGSALTGWDRYFVGASVGLAQLNDALLSVQVTGSPDFWAVHGDPFTQHHPLYESAAGRLTVPTAPRQDIEVTVDVVESNETAQPFLIRQQTLESSIGYRSALSDWTWLGWGAAPGDLTLGVEAARQMRSTFFGPYEVLYGDIDVYQLFGEWDDRWSDPFGHNYLDLSVHGSPGGIDRSNSTLSLYYYSNGAVTSAAYVIAEATFDRTSNLPYGLDLVSEWNGQYAGRAVPAPEQIAIGGPSAVRGYSLDDGAFDDGLVARDELRAPQTPEIGSGELGLKLVPLAFVDAGHGRNEATHADLTVASVGLGTDVQFGSKLTGGVTVSYPLLDTRVTRQGDWRLDARISFAY